MTRAPRLILASRSPRRAQLLEQLGLSFVVQPPEVDETFAESRDLKEEAVRIATLKSAQASATGALAIGCDTIVEHEKELLLKPASQDEAVEMLMRLQGDRHLVHTAISVAQPDRVETEVASTTVWFRAIERRECEEYVTTGEPADKAGAYGIQGFGAAVVERIEGDYYNVMGLPIQQLLILLRRFGWRYAFGGGLVPVR